MDKPETPQIAYEQLTLKDVLPNDEDLRIIKKYAVELLVAIIRIKIPSLAPYAKLLEKIAEDTPFSKTVLLNKS